MRWERLQLLPQQQEQQQQQHLLEEVNGPGKRWGHTCNSIKGGMFLYVFGGYGKDNCQTNQVHIFDTVKKTWSQPVMKGTPPIPRDSHSCTTIGDNLYVFGGTDGLNPLKDLHILDTSSHTWISPSVRGEGPEAREGHSAALVGKRLFLFGGCGKSLENGDEVYYNDLYILNTETYVWKQATTSGTPPSARDSHTCSSWKNKMIVIGGEDGHDYYLSDVHILDTETLVWSELSTSGQKLPPRAGHSTVAFGKLLFIFGGFTDAQNLYDDLYMLDVDAGVWTKVMTVGDGPSARFSVAGDSLDPFRSGILVFIGGCNKSLEALDDMYYLYTGLTCARDDRLLESLSLRKKLKLKYQEQNLSSPLQDKALVSVDTNAGFRNTITSYPLPGRENFPFEQGKKTFQAKVTESFPLGFTIETVIEGKPLRGIIFTNKPGSPQMTNHDTSNGNYGHPLILYAFTRKRAAQEISGSVLNGDYNSMSKAPRTLQQDAVYDVELDSTHGKESSSSERKKELTAPDLTNLTSSNVSQSSQFHELPANPEPSTPLPLNLNEDMTCDAPSFVTEFPCNNFNTVEGPLSLSLSQGMDVQGCTTTTATEVLQNDPGNLFDQ